MEFPICAGIDFRSRPGEIIKMDQGWEAFRTSHPWSILSRVALNVR